MHVRQWAWVGFTSFHWYSMDERLKITCEANAQHLTKYPAQWECTRKRMLRHPCMHSSSVWLCSHIEAKSCVLLHNKSKSVERGNTSAMPYDNLLTLHMGCRALCISNWHSFSHKLFCRADCLRGKWTRRNQRKKKREGTEWHNFQSIYFQYMFYSNDFNCSYCFNHIALDAYMNTFVCISPLTGLFPQQQIKLTLIWFQIDKKCKLYWMIP